MKKLILLLTLLAWPMRAFAELPLVYPADTVISVVALTDAQQALVEHLYGPLLTGVTKIPLPGGTRYDDVGPAMTAIMMDYPEMFHLMRSYTVSYYQSAPDIAVSVTAEYAMDAAEAEEVRRQMYAAALRMMEADRTAEGLHDALLAHVTYSGDSEMSHTAAAALLTGKATCEGYAQALTLLYRMAGIPCGMISGLSASEQMTEGQSVHHAWNIAWLDGYTLIDATWNDQDATGYNTHWYFGLSTEQMAADHVPDQRLNLPECGEQANWHRQHGLVAQDMTQAWRAVEGLVLRGETVNLRIPDRALFLQISGDVDGFLVAYNDLCAQGAQFYGSYTYLFSSAQQCLIIDRYGE